MLSSVNKLPITAILPCYNHATYLAERIQSIRCQSVRVSEIIFLDDASTDSSLQVAQSLLDECEIEVSFYSNQVNSGSPFSQWNKGILLAKYPVIWIAETDDSCHPQLLETLYSKLLASNSVLSFSQSRYINSLSHDIGSSLSYIPATQRSTFTTDFVINGKKFNDTFMKNRNLVPNASAVLFLRDAFVDVGLANPTMRYCGDWDMWLRLADISRVVYVADELNYFRCHSSTTRSNGNTSIYKAEAFACRLRAIFHIYKPLDHAVSFSDMLKYCLSNTPSDIVFMVRRLSIRSFLQVVKSYSKLSSVPQPTLSVWMFALLLLSWERLYSKPLLIFKRVKSLYSSRKAFKTDIP